MEQKATDLLLQYGYDFDCDDYVNIVDFAKTFGFSIWNALLPDNEDGFLAIRPSAPRKIIGVNARRSVEEKRFMIARGFARATLQYADEKIVLHHENRLTANKDDDANHLAGALLMSAASLKREYWRLKSLDIPEKCNLFKIVGEV